MNIFRIAFFAKRDININEELTFDYIGVDTPGGLLKDELLTIDSHSDSTVSSTSSIVFTPPGEETPYISNESYDRPKSNIIIDLSGDDNFTYNGHYYGRSNSKYNFYIHIYI